MNNRIRELRKALGKSQPEFGTLWGVSKSAVQKWESGENIPTNAITELMIQKTGVNAHWLRTGEGEMFLPRTEKDELSAFYETILKENDNSPKRRLLLALSRLDDAQWQVLTNLAKAMAGEE